MRDLEDEGRPTVFLSASAASMAIAAFFSPASRHSRLSVSLTSHNRRDHRFCSGRRDGGLPSSIDMAGDREEGILWACTFSSENISQHSRPLSAQLHFHLLIGPETAEEEGHAPQGDRGGGGGEILWPRCC